MRRMIVRPAPSRLRATSPEWLGCKRQSSISQTAERLTEQDISFPKPYTGESGALPICGPIFRAHHLTKLRILLPRLVWASQGLVAIMERRLVECRGNKPECGGIAGPTASMAWLLSVVRKSVKHIQRRQSWMFKFRINAVCKPHIMRRRRNARAAKGMWR